MQAQVHKENQKIQPRFTHLNIRMFFVKRGFSGPLDFLNVALQRIRKVYSKPGINTEVMEAI